MTLKEIFMEIDGYQWRFNTEFNLHAHFTAQVINANRRKGKAIKAKDLFNPYKEDNVISLEERKKRFEEANKIMGPDVIPVRKRS